MSTTTKIIKESKIEEIADRIVRLEKYLLEQEKEQTDGQQSIDQDERNYFMFLGWLEDEIKRIRRMTRRMDFEDKKQHLKKSKPAWLKKIYRKLDIWD